MCYTGNVDKKTARIWLGRVLEKYDFEENPHLRGDSRKPGQSGIWMPTMAVNGTLTPRGFVFFDETELKEWYESS